jgi:hypothetical protein
MKVTRRQTGRTFRQGALLIASSILGREFTYQARTCIVFGNCANSFSKKKAAKYRSPINTR